MAIQVLVVDDHEIVRKGLASLLAGTGIRICGEAASADEALRQAKKLNPDVVLLDVRLGPASGIGLIKRIRSAAPDARVVMLTGFDNPAYVAQALADGAHDCLLKTVSRPDLVAAVNAAAEGCSPARLGRRGRRVVPPPSPAVDAGVALTSRETDVLRQIAVGLSNREISDALGISVETVKEHVQNLLRKTALGDRTQVAVWAIRHGIA